MLLNITTALKIKLYSTGLIHFQRIPHGKIGNHSTIFVLTSNLEDDVFSRGRECHVPFYN